MVGEKDNNRTPQRRKADPPAESAAPGAAPAQGTGPEQTAGAQPPAPEPPPEAPQEQQPPEPPEPPEEPETPEPHDRAPCPVVGVGASAGGLEALQGLFANLTPDPGIAFVVVQHRASDRTSVMRSLIERFTKLRVVDIVDNTRVRPNMVYLAPADKDVSIMHGILFLTEPPPHLGIRLPIDSFLRTLARDESERAICIVLSGTGSDGTLGLREIKAAGGIAVVQKEEQAKYDSMPRSAIDTGMVDFILPVEKMGEQLAQYVRHPYIERPKALEPEEKVEKQLQRVFLLIRNQTGHDFSHYKRNTIRRRIARRLAVHQIENLEHYTKLLQESREEVNILAREMLITVTNFFRDHEAWDALKEHVIRPLVEQKPPEMPLRVWVAGFATGEEAYTVALLFQEDIALHDRHRVLQIFATDLDEESINIARRGFYPKSIAADVSLARLQQFFTVEGNSYRIKNNIRENIVFAKHDLIKDAPFSKLDLLCCRNVLIYMDTTLQKKLIPMFHYTLNPGGHLFLGESESIGVFADLFAPTDSKNKIFKRKPVETGYEPEACEVGYQVAAKGTREAVRLPQPAHDPVAIGERMILRDYSLPCVLIDKNYNIVFFNGDMRKYLNQPGGRPTFNITQMARPEIRFRLSLLLKRAFQENRIVTEKDVRVRVDDHYLDTDIMARPVGEAGEGHELVLVVFISHPQETKKTEGGGPAVTEAPEEERDTRIRELQQELRSTREYLQTTIEELETSNEELKSSNEELQSTNEELQSTNEELDTSREELQSTNEELRTINAEHQQKIEELSKAYDDLNNLLDASEVATLFLDRDLKIRRFTPPTRKIFRLIDRDIGRPLDDISTTLPCGDLLTDIRSVLDTLTRVDREVECTGGTWYQMKIAPYRTAENVIEGVVITFVDATQQKWLVKAQQAGAFAETVREPLLVLDKDLKIVSGNPAFYRHFQTNGPETIGRQIYELGDGQWNIPELRKLLEEIVPENTKLEDFQVRAVFPKIGARTMLLNARQTKHRGEATGGILLAFEDITERAKNE